MRQHGVQQTETDDSEKFAASIFMIIWNTDLYQQNYGVPYLRTSNLMLTCVSIKRAMYRAVLEFSVWTYYFT
jgi:hypothetical protein